MSTSEKIPAITQHFTVTFADGSYELYSIEDLPYVLACSWLMIKLAHRDYTLIEWDGYTSSENDF